MRFLLLNMPVSFNRWQNLEMPLGLGYIASSLLRSGHEVMIKDFEVERFVVEEMRHIMDAFRPQAVGISFRTASYRSALECARTLRAVDPGVIITCGGHHSTVFSEDVIKDIGCDIVVRGEGEETIRELAAALANKQDLSKIDGISFRKNGNIFHNKDRCLIEDLDDIHFPAWDLLPMKRYSIHSVITSRGCPFSCIYCDKSVSTRQVRYRSAANVYEEILKLKKDYGDKSIYFVDDFFFQNKNRLSEIFGLIKSKNLKWRCQSRADAIDGDLASKAKEAGCEAVIFGLETGDPDELKFIRKNNSLEQSRNAVILTNGAGINVRANFMLGFPISTPKSIMNTVKFAAGLPIDNCRFFLVTPLPNTELWDYVHKHNLIDKDVDWKNFDLYSSSYRIPHISARDLICYAGAAYLYLLKKKTLKELTVDLPKNLFSLIKKVLKTHRLRGNVSPIFGSSVNLALEIWFLIKRKSFADKMSYLARIVSLEGNIAKG